MIYQNPTNQPLFLGWYATWAAMIAVYPNGGTLPANSIVGITAWGTFFTPNAAGTRWKPLNGEFVLQQDAGSLSSPLATLTGATSGTLAIPGGSVQVPADLCAADWFLDVNIFCRKTGTGATATIGITLGTANTAGDAAIGTASSENVSARALYFSASPGFQSSTRALCNSLATSGLGALTSAGDPADATTNVNTASLMYIGVYVVSQAAADTTELLGYSIKVKAPL